LFVDISEILFQQAMTSFFSKSSARKGKAKQPQPTPADVAARTRRPLFCQGALNGVESFLDPPLPSTQLSQPLLDAEFAGFNETLEQEETDEEAAARIALDAGQSQYDEEQTSTVRNKAITTMLACGVKITAMEAASAINVITKVCSNLYCWHILLKSIS
jgi:hypothetical protein